MMLFRCHTKVKGRQKGKHVGLNQGYQQFKYKHKHGKGQGQNGYTVSQCGLHLTKNKNQAEKPQGNDMPG